MSCVISKRVSPEACPASCLRSGGRVCIRLMCLDEFALCRSSACTSPNHTLHRVHSNLVPLFLFRDLTHSSVPAVCVCARASVVSFECFLFCLLLEMAALILRAPPPLPPTSTAAATLPPFSFSPLPFPPPSPLEETGGR